MDEDRSVQTENKLETELELIVAAKPQFPLTKVIEFVRMQDNSETISNICELLKLHFTAIVHFILDSYFVSSRVKKIFLGVLSFVNVKTLHKKKKKKTEMIFKLNLYDKLEFKHSNFNLVVS